MCLISEATHSVRPHPKFWQLEAIHTSGAFSAGLGGMEESAQAAMSYVRSRAQVLGLEPDFYQKVDVHVHFPEFVRKDGPSAGVTMAVSLLSAYTGVPVRKDLAMTGEITLTGLVLPVGGIKEKMLAARRAGIGGIIGECGGACSCATCHVYVDESWSHTTGPATGSEADMLEFADEVRPLSRLSCQIKVTPELDGLTLHLPAGQGH